MKQLTCEMCGSPNLIKQDGLFICQNCGTKYSVEEAKKMMIDGPVDVSGSTVNINNSEKLSNLYQVARRFRNDNNAINAEKYYQMVLVEDPTSWEASFYVVYFSAMQCKIAEIRSAANSVSNCLKNVFSLIKSNCAVEEQKSAVNEVVEQCKVISNFLFNGAKNRYYEIDKSNSSQSAIQEYEFDYSNRMTASRDIMYTCGDSINGLFSNNKVIMKYAVNAWQEGINLHRAFISEKWSMNHGLYNDKRDLAVIGSYKSKMSSNYNDARLKMELEMAENDIPRYFGIWRIFGLIFIAFAVIFTIACICIGYLGGILYSLLILILALFILFIDSQKRGVVEEKKKNVERLRNELNRRNEQNKQEQQNLSSSGTVSHQVVDQQNQAVYVPQEQPPLQNNRIPNTIPALMYAVDGLNTAQEIYYYLLEFHKVYPNVLNNVVWENLYKTACAEQMCGNQKQVAINILKQYFNIP